MYAYGTVLQNDGVQTCDGYCATIHAGKIIYKRIAYQLSPLLKNTYIPTVLHITEFYGFGIIQYSCIKRSEMISSFVPDESACYDFLDHAVWDSITTESYPSDRFSRMVASFCSSDNCNALDGPCDAETRKKGNLFLNMQSSFDFKNVPYPLW